MSHEDLHVPVIASHAADVAMGVLFFVACMVVSTLVWGGVALWLTDSQGIAFLAILIGWSVGMSALFPWLFAQQYRRAARGYGVRLQSGRIVLPDGYEMDPRRVDARIGWSEVFTYATEARRRRPSVHLSLDDGQRSVLIDAPGRAGAAAWGVEQRAPSEGAQTVYTAWPHDVLRLGRALGLCHDGPPPPSTHNTFGQWMWLFAKLYLVIGSGGALALWAITQF